METAKNCLNKTHEAHTFFFSYVLYAFKRDVPFSNDVSCLASHKLNLLLQDVYTHLLNDTRQADS